MPLNLLDRWIGQTRQPGEILAELARRNLPADVEIEHSRLRFKSKFLLKNGSVVSAKPRGLEGLLSAGRHIRVRLAGDAGTQVRVQVSVPHFNLANGTPTFICKPPDGLLRSRRRVERFNSSRYQNLRLEIGVNRFRLIDISPRGCKVLLGLSQDDGAFALGKELRSARLILGEWVVNLVKVIPRNFDGRTIGCEFQVQNGDMSNLRLINILGSIEKAQQQPGGA